MKYNDYLRDDNDSILRKEEKSVPLLMEYIERFTNENDMVMDLFAGTGSCALACLNLKRVFIGCDKDAEVVTYGRQRIISVTKDLVNKSNY